MSSDSGLEFPSSTIDHFEPSLGYVTLTGTVTPAGRDLARLAVIPYAWRFAPGHGSGHGHGWRRASKDNFTRLDEHGNWIATDVRPAVQYAVIVVDIDPGLHGQPDRLLSPPIPDAPGTLPRGTGFSEFTHQVYGIHIGSAPDDHLTGAVLGVRRASWDEPGPDSGSLGNPKLWFRMAAWATRRGEATEKDVAYFVGEARCAPSGYWTFGDLGAIDDALKRSHTFTVALVTEAFVAPAANAPSPIPPLGGVVKSINSRPHQPLRTHGPRLPN
jgi:hypothetical protein